MLLGEETAEQIGRAFGTGTEIWINLDRTWREHQRIAVERARLERLVIEAAKKWYAQAIEHDFDLYPEEQVIADSIKTLIDFESSQQQIKK